MFSQKNIQFFFLCIWVKKGTPCDLSLLLRCVEMIAACDSYLLCSAGTFPDNLSPAPCSVRYVWR